MEIWSTAARLQLRQEGVAAGLLRLDHGRVAEAEVQRGLALHALQRPVDRLHRVGARGLGPGLHVGLVELHDVGAGGEEVPDLLVHRFGVGHGEAFVVRVVGVLRLLGHGEGAGQRDLDRPLRVGAQELDVLHLDGSLAPDRAAETRGTGAGFPVRSMCVPIRSLSMPPSAVASRLE